jgi:hypothetical protein
MKRISTLLLLALLLSKQNPLEAQQSCISFGCAHKVTNITADGTLPDIFSNGFSPGCYDGNTYKQLFWQFFLSTGGGFRQTFTPTSTGDPLSLNYVVFDIGTTPPASFNCPVNSAGWTILDCMINDWPGMAVGPGTFSSPVIPTVAGHFYAIAIIFWQGTSNRGDASYTFNIEAPSLNNVPLNAANCSDVIIPVKLLSFDAQISNCVVDLNWSAENEFNFKNYEVQSSNDGVNFRTLAIVNPSGQAESLKNYSYRDIHPLHGKEYYRLKMTDLNGSFKYSKSAMVNVDCYKQAMLVFPNPVNDLLYIDIASLLDNNTTGSLFDVNGKLIYSGKLVIGTNTIDMTKFTNGVYLLKISNKFQLEYIKVVK